MPMIPKWYIEFESDTEAHMFGIKQHVLSTKTKFQQVDIVDTYSYGRGLFTDGLLQSAEADEYIYHEALVHPAMVAHEHPQKVFIAGGGEGATLREVLKHNTVKRVVMVDIDKELVELCQKLMPQWSAGSFHDPRAEVLYQDALRFAEKTGEKFDVIIVDVSDPDPGGHGPADGLFSDRFYRALKNTLTPGGILTIQAGPAYSPTRRVYPQIMDGLSRIFKFTTMGLSILFSFLIPWAYCSASDALNISKIEPQLIDKRLTQRGCTNLKFYDGLAHRHMFSLPKNFRNGPG